VAVTDAAVLSNRVDGVVLVTQAGKTRRDLARQAVLNLKQAGANIFGGMINRVSKKEGGYYHQYYTPKKLKAVNLSNPANGSQRRWQWLPFK
jgi:Mrp family chromosome partitioning ATPase